MNWTFDEPNEDGFYLKPLFWRHPESGEIMYVPHVLVLEDGFWKHGDLTPCERDYRGPWLQIPNPLELNGATRHSPILTAARSKTERAARSEGMSKPERKRT